jgi:porphobilinogen synthase
MKPYIRPRRLRTSETLRAMVRETHVTADDLIQPLFVIHGEGVRNPIKSMPGYDQVSIDNLLRDLDVLTKKGVRAILPFGIPETKDFEGSDSFSDEGIIQRAVRAVKARFPELYVITDVCLCEYTDHGHCGPVIGTGIDSYIDNDATLALLQKQVITHARAGADMVAPSGMMDGMVGAIRDALDGEGYEKIPIMSYAAKYASAFYGPFRDAAGSAPSFGDRRAYQMDPANSDEAMREVELDIEEGADIIMVKPAMAYLDIIHRVKTEYGLPTAAYQVSGEFSMIEAAAEKGWIDRERVMRESLTSIKRAGADLIISYFTKELADKL